MQSTSPRQIIATLSVPGGASALEFYERAFAARRQLELMMPDGRLGHAELAIGDATLYLAGEFPEYGVRAPDPGDPVSVTLALYVDDVDAWTERAVAAGATLERAPNNEFYGDRVSSLRDPSGYRWRLHTRVEEVSEEELRRRLASS